MPEQMTSTNDQSWNSFNRNDKHTHTHAHTHAHTHTHTRTRTHTHSTRIQAACDRQIDFWPLLMVLLCCSAGTSREPNVTSQFRFSWDSVCLRPVVHRKTIFRPISAWKSTGSRAICRWGSLLGVFSKAVVYLWRSRLANQLCNWLA